MAYPLQFLDAEATNLEDTTAPVPLTVGANFQPNDVRIAWVWVNTSTFSTFPGWTKVYDASLSGDRGGMFVRTLQAGDTDGVLTLAGGAGLGAEYLAVTVRNTNPSQSWVPGSAVFVAAANCVAPSVTTSAGGVMLTFNLKITGDITAPAPGMTQLAHSMGTHGLMLAGQGFASSGSSGTKTAVAPASTAYWAQSLFIIASPDISSAITASAETDAGIAVTSALGSTTTNIITPALEVDSGVEVYNPLSAVSIRPPVVLTGDPVTASRVSWSAATPAAGSAVKVETSLDGGASWQLATNGAAVPGLTRGDTTTPTVLTRATMTRLRSTDTSPYFMSLKTEVSVDTSYNELVSLGVFLITQVDITETGGPSGAGSGGGGSGNGVTGTGGSSAGGGLSLTVSGIDLSYAVSRNTWTDIFYVPAETNYAIAALEIAQNRLPGITSDVSSTEVTAERLLFGTNQGNDPWQDIQDMGTAIGYEAYFDPIATFRFKAIADPSLTPSVWTVSDAANPVMVSYTRSISDSTTYNYVVVSGESTSNVAPVSAVAFDADPSSPTYYLGPYGVVTTTFVSAMITTQAQAQQAADALLLVVKGASETVEITMVPNPALEPGDVITVTRTFNGQKIIQGTFLINSISTPLAQSQAQTLVCYRQSAAQG